MASVDPSWRQRPYRVPFNIMKISTQSSKSDTPVHDLGNVPPGTPIRFTNITVETAIAEGLFWIVLDTPELDKKRRRVACPASGKVMERDADWQVRIVDAEFVVHV